MSMRKRVARLEQATARPGTHEECLDAMERLANPPPGYTDAQRDADEAMLWADAQALIAAGLD